MRKYVALYAALVWAQIMMAQQPVMMKYIPENASMVVNFNPVHVASKVPGEHFRQSVLYKQIVEKGDAGIKAFFNDPSVTGIDFSANIWVISTKEGSEPGTPGISIFGVLKDVKTFSKNMEKLAKGEQQVKQYGTDRVLMPDGSGPALAWNNEVFVLTVPGKKKPRVDSPVDEEIIIDTISYLSDEELEAKWKAEQERKMKAVRNYCFELLTPKQPHRITSSVIFRKAMSNEGDVRLWSDGGPKEALKKINPMAKEISKLTELSGKEVATVITFENGQITARVHNYPNEEALALYKRHPHPAAPVDLLRKLPQQPVMGLFAASFNTELTKELLKQAGMENLMDSLHKNVPMLDKLKGAFSGGVMFAVLKSDKPAQENQKLKGVDIIRAIPVLDRSKVEGLKTEISKLMKAEKEEGKKSKLLDGLNPAVRINDKVLVLASSESVAQSYFDNDGSSPVPAWVPSSQYPFLVDINFGAVINTVLGAAGKGGKSAELEKIFGQFDHITVSGGQLVDDHLESKLSFGFTNKQDNAMVQIFDLVNQFLAQGGKKKE